MIPLKDNETVHVFPLVNTLLIAANVLVFLFDITLGPNALKHELLTWGLVPERFLLCMCFAQVKTIFTSMFLHSGWLHLISNMWALFIFGDNVEDSMGHLRYLLFYLICGVAAATTQIIAQAYTTLPMIGASGAIAGVLGAYLLLYPRSKVLTLIPIFFIPYFLEIPAIIYLGFWFFAQFFAGLFSLSRYSAATQQGGIAVWAHVGGFCAGLILVKLFAQHKEPPRPQQWYSGPQPQL